MRNAAAKINFQRGNAAKKLVDFSVRSNSKRQGKGIHISTGGFLREKAQYVLEILVKFGDRLSEVESVGSST